MIYRAGVLVLGVQRRSPANRHGICRTNKHGTPPINRCGITIDNRSVWYRYTFNALITKRCTAMIQRDKPRIYSLLPGQ